MKWITVSILFILGYSPLFSQTYAELSGKYKEESAIALEKQTEVNFEFNTGTGLVEVIEVVQIKIMGLTTNNNINLNFDYDENSVISSMSTTPAGRYTKICGDINPEGVFHSGMKMCLYTLNFKYPGEIITCKATRKFSDAHFYNNVYFTIQYPVLKSIIVVHKPAGLDMDIKNFNTEDYSFTTNEVKDAESTIFTFTCANTPGNLREENKPPIPFINPHLLLVPRNYRYKETNYPYFDGLPGFYHWCKNMSDRCINHPEQLKNTVNTIIAGKTTDLEKAKAIYYWVQDKIRYIAFENGLAGYIPESAEVVCENRFGDCKGMANLLKTMLSIAGIDGRLTWVGTNDIPYDFSTPSLVSVNHMVCTAILNGNYYVLDATIKYNSFNQTPLSFQGRQILIEDGDKYILYKVPGFNPEKDYLESNYSYTIDKESMTGRASVKFLGLEKSNILEGLNSLRVDEQQLIMDNIITHKLSKVKSGGVQHSDIANKEDGFEIKGNIEVTGQLMNIDNEMYIHPDLFEDYQDYFVRNDRTSPMYFPFPEHRKTSVSIDLPAGYKISTLPNNYSLKNDFCDLKVSYNIKENKIVFEKDFSLLKTIIPKPKFQEWNDAIKQYKKACLQQIILSK